MQESAQSLFCLDVPEFVVSCVQGLGDGEILIRGYQYTGHALSVSIRFCRSIQGAWCTDFIGSRRETVDISGNTLAFSALHAKIMTFFGQLLQLSILHKNYCLFSPFPPIMAAFSVYSFCLLFLGAHF